LAPLWNATWEVLIWSMRRANLVHKWDTAIHTCKTELFQTEQEKKQYTTPKAQINLFGALKKQSLISPSVSKKIYFFSFFDSST
jgi:hypothetical protein